MDTNKLLQEMVPVEKLNKSPYNPRLINAIEFDALKKSLEEFGFVEPLVVNTRDHESFNTEEKGWYIVGGHQRFEAAKSLGYKEVPVVFVNVNKEKEKILNLALNKISGEWDTDKLAEILYGLTQDDNIPESDILGFSHEEISAILDTVMETGDEDEDFSLDKGLGDAKNTKVKLGDIYKIGRHKLMCGDSTKKEDVDKLMSGEQSDLLFTDPPFNVELDYNSYEDNKSTEEYLDFCKSFMANADSVMRPNSCAYIMTGDKYLLELGNLFKKMFRFSQVLFWVKDNPTLGNSDYQYNYEAILYGWKKGGTHKFYGGSVVPAANFVKRDTGEEKVEHPAQRPVKLVNDYIKNSSLQGELVLDLFGGSGTTMVSAHMCNRRCNMIEMDPQYVQVIIDRIEKLTKQKAVKI
jgi:DNA modification methylase